MVLGPGKQYGGKTTFDGKLRKRCHYPAQFLQAFQLNADEVQIILLAFLWKVKGSLRLSHSPLLQAFPPINAPLHQTPKDFCLLIILP